MAKSRPKKRNPNPFGARPRQQPRRRRNAGFLKNSHRPRRRRNPGELVGRSIDVVTAGAQALVGLVVTRQVPQMLLSEKNAGPIGYIANLATALAAGALAGKMLSPKAGFMVAIGGGLYLVNRLLSEQVSPIGRVLSLAGVGDAQAAGSLGAIVPGYFVKPVSYGPNGQPLIPRAIRESFPAPAPVSALRGIRAR